MDRSFGIWKQIGAQQLHVPSGAAPATDQSTHTTKPIPYRGYPAMRLTMRKYRGEDDFWRIREFLREVLVLNGRREVNWQSYRFDYCRWHVFENIEHLRMEDVVFIWEAPDERIAAVLNPEGKGEGTLQGHPGL